MQHLAVGAHHRQFAEGRFMFHVPRFAAVQEAGAWTTGPQRAFARRLLNAGAENCIDVAVAGQPL